MVFFSHSWVALCFDDVPLHSCLVCLDVLDRSLLEDLLALVGDGDGGADDRGLEGAVLANDLDVGGDAVVAAGLRG